MSRALVGPQEAWALLRKDAAVAIDCRADLANRDPAVAEALYAAAHLPGAARADLDRDLADLAIKGRGRHPLPDAEAFSRSLSAWGIAPGTVVIAYDAAGGALAAARLWWMLRLVGHDEVAVLDGGWQAWLAAGLPVETGIEARTPVQREVRYDRARIVETEALQRGLAASRIALLDARAAPRFRGELEPLDPVAGHVPGARNRPYTDNLAADGRFKGAAELAADFRALARDHPPQDTVLMCGSGVTACHNLLAMEHAGLHGARIYPGSWSEWVSDPARPVAIGPA
jgi:thiosulfate/3-mercaptopyruvate sulfurtransferase